MIAADFRLLTAMMASETTNNCSTTKPVAVVAPCPRLTDDPENVIVQSLSASEQASMCDDATSTEHHQHQTQATSIPPGHHQASDDHQRCSENTEDAARSNQLAVDRRTSTCTVRPSQRVVEPDDNDDYLTCRFYHGNITADEAKRRLADRSQGTYLLRDSQSTSFPFSLSLRTCGRSGVTSLRIARDGNNFRLDCDEEHQASMPTFGSVLQLVRHFVAECDGGEGGRCVLVGSSGRHEQPLTLRRPLQRPSLTTNNDH